MHNRRSYAEDPLLSNIDAEHISDVHSAYVFQSDVAKRKRSPTQRPLLQRLRYSWPLGVLVCLLLSPVAGSVLIYHGIRERTGPIARFSQNPGDWMVVVFIGAMMQASLCAPIAYLASPQAFQELVTELQADGDYYGAFIFPTLLGFYALVTLFFFRYFEDIHTRPKVDDIVSSPTVKTAVAIKVAIEQSTTLRSELIMVAALALGVIEMLLIRLCPLSSLQTCHSFFIFSMDKFSESDYYLISTVESFLLFTCFNGCLFFSLLAYYQQLLQVQEFRFVGRGGSSGLLNENSAAKATAMLEDLNSPDNISTWTYTWQQIVMDIKRRPITRSTTTSAFGAAVLSLVCSVAYIFINNLWTRVKVATFTTGLSSVAVVSACVILSFVFVTVKLNASIDSQAKTIAKLQSDMQLKLDHEGHDMDLMHRQMLVAKVRVLHSLDTYLRFANSKPKLIGLSMESLRWSVIILGLMLLNVFFFALYYTHCIER